MKKCGVFFTLFPLALLIVVLSLNETQPLNTNDYTLLNENQVSTVKLPVETVSIEQACFKYPVLDKSFVAFKEAVAFKESGGDYFTTNTLGYLGKYQFGTGTLNILGVYNAQQFLSDPILQEKAFIANTMRNKWVLRRDIKRFIGRRIDGVLVTESGILAAAHLAGPGSVKKYLRSYGAVGFTDAYGTSIRNYMKRFSGYDTTDITPDKKAKVSKI